MSTPNQHYLRISQRNAEESALLRLPPEIRNLIWSYAVHAETLVSVHLVSRRYPTEWPVQGMSRVCRQVHAETRLLAYTVNTFTLVNTAYLTAWLMMLLPEQKAAIQRIQVGDYQFSYDFLQLLPGLKSIVVECFCNKAVVDDCTDGKAIINHLEDILGNSGLKIQRLPIEFAALWPQIPPLEPVEAEATVPSKRPAKKEAAGAEPPKKKKDKKDKKEKEKEKKKKTATFVPVEFDNKGKQNIPPAVVSAADCGAYGLCGVTRASSRYQLYAARQHVCGDALYKNDGSLKAEGGGRLTWPGGFDQRRCWDAFENILN
ncbi:unnamed protein product [Alternaria alternata]